MSTKHTLELTNDEALVLSDFLYRFNRQVNETIFEDQAEQKVLSILEGQLDYLLTEPFEKNYIQLVNQARERIRDDDGFK